jgi:hypothetical protein
VVSELGVRHVVSELGAHDVVSELGARHVVSELGVRHVVLELWLNSIPLLGKLGLHPRRTVSKHKRPWWKNPSKTKKSRWNQLGRRNHGTGRTKMSPKVRKSNEARSYSPRSSLKSSSK